MALRKAIAVSAVVAFAACCFARDKSGDNWFFGYGGGVTFVNGTPEPLTGGQINQLEGCASISNSAGDLLFYTDGITVWNANNTIMPNGTSLLGNPSASQSGIIVPKPGDPDIYYIFTVPATSSSAGLNYTIVDMTLDSGNGDVDTGTKNVNLMSTCSEQVTAVAHANGSDIWVLARPYNGNAFHAFLVSSSGINPTPVISNAGTNIMATGDIGYLKASSDGSKLAMAYYTQSGLVELYDFDNSTGTVSNAQNLGTFSGAYGIEFSQDGVMLYTGRYTVGIVQFDLTAGDIPGSAYVVGSDSTTALQLGPDGKIYAGASGQSYLAVINSPSLAGAACDYVFHGPDISGTCAAGLPSFIQSFFAGSADFTTPEDTALSFMQDDFAVPYNDSTTETLAQVKFTSVPTNGTLSHGGTAVAMNDEVAASVLNSLIYTPTANFNGSDSFGWDGNSGGSYNFTGTFSIDVTPVADAPSVTTPTGAQIGVLTSGGLVISTNANDGAEITYWKITAISGGTLYLADGTTEVSVGDFITAAQGAAGLRFVASSESCSITIAGATSNNDADVSSITTTASFTATAAPPTVTTTAVSSITGTTAGGGGNVTDDGGGTITARGVCWSTSPYPTTADSKTTDGTGSGAFTSSITGLMPLTTYHVRAYATNSGGTSYGSDVEFTTITDPPTVTTAAVSDVATGSATSGGNVTSDGGAEVTARGVCWNTTGTPTIDDSKTSDGTGTGEFASSLTGLTPETAYHVRAYATNSQGTSYGAERTFTTASEHQPAPNLRVTVTTTTATANVGDELTFDVQVQNEGDGNATSVVLRFTLPAGTEFVQALLVQGQSAQSTALNAFVEGDEIVVELGNVAISESQKIRIVLKATAAGEITLQASVSSAEQPTPATAQVDTSVEVDDVYYEVVSTTRPVLGCGLFGFFTLALTMAGLMAMKRRRYGV